MSADLRLAAAPPPEQRRLALRDALAAVVPGWRPLARDVLGADARIDWVGRDGEGRCVLVLLADAGEDLALVAQGLAQREWVAARLADWVQLAPESGLRPSSDVEVVLLAPEFAPATCVAARALSDRGLRLVALRFVQNGTGVAPLLDPLGLEGGAGRGSGSDAGFRSGLSPEDLDLTPEERADFERT